MIRFFWLLVVGSFGYYSVSGQVQQVAPGVPPQRYQQVPQHQQVPPVQQQQQYQQHQFQQAPSYQQQVPTQQQHVPQHVPLQQHQQHQPQVPIPDASQGHHHAHEGQPQILNAANIAHEKEHIREHLDVPMDTSKMTDQELQFHYFKMHDADNNNKLDGCELIKSLIHWHAEQGHNNKEGQTPTAGEKLFKDEELVALIDPILNMDDSNKDGFIDYPEFIQAQQKAAASGRP